MVCAFILYFGHQCNGTLTIVHAMLSILTDEFQYRKHETMYTNLVRASCFVRGVEYVPSLKDAGAGPENRFKPSNTQIFDEEEVLRVVGRMRTIFDDFSNIMKNTCEVSKKQNKTKEMMLNHHNLSVALAREIDGVREFQAAQIISFAALVGLLPLEFYVNIPMHLGGGPGRFMMEHVNWSSISERYAGKHDNIKVITWSAETVDEMTDLFGSQFTSNLLENGSCIIGRGTDKHDLHFLLPWTKGELTKSFEWHHQLEFRVVPSIMNKWELVAFDGNKKVVFLSSNNPCVLQESTNSGNGVCHMIHQDLFLSAFTGSHIYEKGLST